MVKKSQSNIAKLYLLFYNVVEAIGWSVLLVYLLQHIISSGAKEPLFQHVKWLVLIFPNSAVLEVIHAILGLVPSNPFATALQVYSRVLIVCGVILPSTAAKDSIGLELAIFAWSFTEVIRYSFYGLNLYNVVPHFLLWLRYSCFIVLYPLGLCAELLMIYAAQQEFGKKQMWSLSLPNRFNLTFNYQYFLVMQIFAFIAACGVLYKHMIIQRKKALGSSTVRLKGN